MGSLPRYTSHVAVWTCRCRGRRPDRRRHPLRSDRRRGLIHDHCSAFHPMGIGSPYLSKLDLERYGLIWRWAEVDCAHPLDNGDAGVLYRSLEQTAAGLGADGPRWQRMFGDLSTGFDALASDLMRPIVNVPRHPLRLAGFGPRALLPATVTAKLWKTDRRKALFGGVAAHAFYPLNRPATSAVGLMITAAGHRYGWPVAEGGSRSITDAMSAMLPRSRRQDRHRHSGSHWPPRFRTPMLFCWMSIRGALEILGDRLPGRVARAYRKFKQAPERSRSILRSKVMCRGPIRIALGPELSIWQVVSTKSWPLSQYLADSPDPPGTLIRCTPMRTCYTDMPATLRRRSFIVATTSSGTADLAQDNPNQVGGDIIGGANTELQHGIAGTYLCSASTPPGAGAHGMCGYNAAESALKYLRRKGAEVL
ncbi:unnamed protein product, partial [Mesorhabditis spiculigera]